MYDSDSERSMCVGLGERCWRCCKFESFKILEVRGGGSSLMEEKLSEFCSIFEK